MRDFDYLGEKTVYLDAACQSLRPKPVVEALENYYYKHNSCGERVKYPWGEKTDALVAETRKKVLKFLKLKSKDYFVSFTLNTTYGVNILLNEINRKYVKKVVTSEIEHNSPFLATMAMSERLEIPRVVLKRQQDGALRFEGGISEIARNFWGVSGDDVMDYQGAVVVVNVAANFDGRRLENLKDVVRKVHKDGGIIILDAAQAMAHSSEILEKTEADAICFSAHKMYAASLGVMVVRKDLIKKLKICWIGGGMVDDVFEDRYLLSSENDEHLHTIFEPGLQAWGEIISLGAAIDWLEKRSKKEKELLKSCTSELDSFLRNNSKIHMVGNSANPTMAFYVDGIESHLLAAALGKEGIMARAGYFCVHYYLDKVMKYPPLVRFSLSYATRESDIERVKKAMRKI